MQARDSSLPALTVVIPVYNGAATIDRLVSTLATLDVPGGHEIVLVNDGSEDDSAERCLNLVETAAVPIAFLDLARNFGEHNAVLAGLRHAKGWHVITIDDDLQNPPSEVIRLYTYALESGKDVIYSSFKKKRHAGWRNLGSFVANTTANIVLDKPRDLYLSSFRCMSRFLVDEVVRHKGPFPYIDGLIFDTTQHVGSLEVDHLENVQARKNYTVRRLLRLWVYIVVNFSIMPLRVSIVLGVILSVLGVLGSISVIVEYFQGVIPVDGWASLMVVTLLFSGFQFLMLGVIGEYLGRLYMTHIGRPQSVVRTIYTNEDRHKGLHTDIAQ